ncbi:MAG TPA: hypothetical protein VEX36_09310 [Thermoleophilaceae bacterium]|nr:hypothetical protein [Thermoleophilaceae bacterium]
MTALEVFASLGGTLLGGLIIRVLGAFAAEEAKGTVKQRGRRILRTAAECLPEAERDRWHAEWLAEYETLAERPIKALLWALAVRSKANAQASALEGERARVGWRARRRARQEARRQVRADTIRKRLEQGGVRAAIDSALGQRGASARLALLGAIAREGGAGRMAISRALAERIEGRQSIAVATALGRTVGTGVGFVLRGIGFALHAIRSTVLGFIDGVVRVEDRLLGPLVELAARSTRYGLEALAVLTGLRTVKWLFALAALCPLAYSVASRLG